MTASLVTATATGQGSDTLNTIEGFLGSELVDNLTGDANPNTIDGAGGNDALNGGGGLDTASFQSSPAGVTASLATGTATGDGSDTLALFENLLGSELVDNLTGNANPNVIDGASGNDTTNGGAGLGDIASFASAPAAVTASLTTNTATGDGSDTLAGFEGLLGSKFNDKLTGDNNANTFDGGTGTDTCSLKNGLDTGARCEIDDGAIETIGASDTFTFPVTAGQKVYIESTTTSTCNTRWKLTTPTGTLFDTGFCADQGPFVPAATGTWTLTVSNPTTTSTYAFRFWYVQPPQTFAYTVGNTVSNGVPGPGAGNTETPATEDRYTFAGTAGQKVFFDSLPPVGCSNAIRWQLLNPSATQIFESGVCSDFGQVTLPTAGTYTLRVYGLLHVVGTYSFRIRNVPAPQTFAYTIGNTVSNGVPAAGAGNIETPGAEDRYTFTGAAGQKVFFDSLFVAGCTNAIRFRLLNPSSAQIFETGVCTDFGQVTLPTAGTYTIRTFTTNPSDAVGTYSFRVLNVPAAQTFGYTVGNTVSNGVPAAGAGNIETPGAQDRYTFTGSRGPEGLLRLALRCRLHQRDPLAAPEPELGADLRNGRLHRLRPGDPPGCGHLHDPGLHDQPLGRGGRL